MAWRGAGSGRTGPNSRPDAPAGPDKPDAAARPLARPGLVRLRISARSISAAVLSTFCVNLPCMPGVSNRSSIQRKKALSCILPPEHLQQIPKTSGPSGRSRRQPAYLPSASSQAGRRGQAGYDPARCTFFVQLAAARHRMGLQMRQDGLVLDRNASVANQG